MSCWKEKGWGMDRKAKIREYKDTPRLGIPTV